MFKTVVLTSLALLLQSASASADPLKIEPVSPTDRKFILEGDLYSRTWI